MEKYDMYECEICGCLHPWDWDADCRDNNNRFPDTSVYAAKLGIDESLITVYSWEERLDADANGGKKSPA